MKPSRVVDLMVLVVIFTHLKKIDDKILFGELQI